MDSFEVCTDSLSCAANYHSPGGNKLKRRTLFLRGHVILKNGGSLCPLVGIIFEFTADGRSVVEWLSALPPSKKLFDLQKSCLTFKKVV